MPGNAFQSLLLNPNLPPDAYEKTLALYGLDKPLLERLQLYIVNFFKGDFGYSYIYFPKSPVELIAERLPRTLMLFSIVNIVAFYTGFLVGKILAWRRGSKSETWITIGSVFSYTVFYPWFALMMLWFFGYKLDWFPLGKFLVPEKWYDSPYSSDEVFYTLILFTTVLSFLLFFMVPIGLAVPVSFCPTAHPILFRPKSKAITTPSLFISIDFFLEHVKKITCYIKVIY